MKKNELILYSCKDLDLNALSDAQIYELTFNLLQSVNIKNLEEKIHEVILKLSGVAGPCFGADAVIIALDNQERLELIHQLIYHLDIFKSNFKYLKSQLKNKEMIQFIDGEQLYGFLYKTKDLINAIWNYGSFNENEKKQNMEELEAYLKRKELYNGES